jgi:cytochrome c oxidase assembly protein subunit 15
MANAPATTPIGPRWLHALAVLTALAALPLLFLGAEVTTRQVGMVDPAWPTVPWHLWLTGWLDRGLGFLIEHGHRLAGWLVGFGALALMIGMWLREPRRWLCWLATAAACGVALQGLLGGLRVRLNELLGPDLALIHGCFGQLVFSLLVSVAVCTSRRWTAASETPPEESTTQRRWSTALVCLLLLQLLLGALLRHKGGSLAQRGHLLVAFAVVATAAWLVRETWNSPDRRLQLTARFLAVLIVLQLLLGVEAWMVKFATPAWQVAPPRVVGRDMVRSAHVLVGSLILATSVVAALAARWRAEVRQHPVVHRLEGAA